MATEFQEVCKCCLSSGEHKDLWAVYVRDGEVEIYGEMVKECFELPWSESEDQLEKICDSCVERLRTSLMFRHEIIAAQQELGRLLRGELKEVKTYIKVEKNIKNEQKDETIQNEREKYAQDLEEGSQMADSDVGDDTADEQNTEYLSWELEESVEQGMEVEYLEDDAEAESAVQTVDSIKTTNKGHKDRSKKTKYKQYTQGQMTMAIDAVMNETMTMDRAAEAFSVPVKTLRFKVRTYDKKQDDEVADTEAKKKQLNFYNEIRTILTYTNSTPFKSKVGRLFCAYCSSEGPVFETPTLLRTHTRTKHAHERLRNVEMCMRPSYLNEILKMDIENLQCTVCTLDIDNWNQMFEHLKEIHDVELDQAYTKVVPFVLSDPILCCLCGQKFSHLHLLDSHMNSHYSNYICGDCGDTFLTESRLKKHEETHSTKKFPCQECGKVFTLDKYRRKHYYGVHLKERRFKCIYCQESFTQDYSRHHHLLEKHKDKVKTISCEYCGQSFTWRPYYLKHIRLNHTKPDKKHQCKLCDKTFYQRNELKHHEEWHIGKGYTCMICQKKFSSKPYLQKHIASHSNDASRSDYIVVLDDDTVENDADNESGEFVLGD